MFNRISKMRGWTGQDFYCAFSPERVDPLNKDWNLRNTPKLVSGINVASQEKAIEFYETFVDRVVSTQKIEIAEFAKLIENAYRLVNISFVNEMSKLASAVGLSIVDILDAASTKPYGFQRFNPGLGAGGHCIPVDPVYLHKFAQDKNIELPILKEAIKTNNRLPLYHATQINNLLNGNLDPNRKVLLVGISYKPGVADLRESQSISLLRELEKFGIDTYWEDPLASNSPFGKKHDHRNVYDVVVLNHSFLATDRYQIQPKGHFYVVS